MYKTILFNVGDGDLNVDNDTNTMKSHVLREREEERFVFSSSLCLLKGIDLLYFNSQCKSTVIILFEF